LEAKVDSKKAKWKGGFASHRRVVFCKVWEVEFFQDREGLAIFLAAEDLWPIQKTVSPKPKETPESMGRLSLAYSTPKEPDGRRRAQLPAGLNG
jgi:hypothetical protein